LGEREKKNTEKVAGEIARGEVKEFKLVPSHELPWVVRKVREPELTWLAVEKSKDRKLDRGVDPKKIEPAAQGCGG